MTGKARLLGNLVGNQAVWLCAVIAAGQGHAWPGVLAALVYCTWQLALSTSRGAELRLMAVALAAGIVIDGGLATLGWAQYAASWPGSTFAPAWILALWLAFVPTLTLSLAFLQRSTWLAVAFGAIGGPLAYLGAARGFDALAFSHPVSSLVWLAIGWGVAMPLLAGLARHWTRPAVASLQPAGDSPA